jgi:hypothetical protein
VYNHHHHLSREKKKYVISSAIEIPPGVSMGGRKKEDVIDASRIR